MAIELPGTLARHIAAVNAHDTDAIMATFTDNAFVNDAHREFRGLEAIRAWVEAEMVSARVRIEPVDLVTHGAVLALHGRYDGDYDKTGLPDPLILTNYVTLSDDAIDTLIIIKNDRTDQS